MLDNSQPRGWHKEIRDSRPTVSRHWKIYDIFGYFEDFWEFRGKKIRLFLGQLHFTWQRSPKGKRSLCVYDNARIVFGFLVTLCVFTRAVAMMKPAIPTGAACGGGDVWTSKAWFQADGHLFHLPCFKGSTTWPQKRVFSERWLIECLHSQKQSLMNECTKDKVYWITQISIIKCSIRQPSGIFTKLPLCLALNYL